MEEEGEGERDRKKGGKKRGKKGERERIEGEWEREGREEERKEKETRGGSGEQKIQSAHIRSVTQSSLTLCDPMNSSTPGLLVHHQLPEFTQTHVHQVSDAIQPSHPLSSPSPLASNHSKHQSLFQ